MRLGIVDYFFIAILLYLLVVNWKGTQALISTFLGGASGVAKTLQGR